MMTDDDLDLRLGRLRLAAYSLVHEGELLAVAARQSRGFGQASTDENETKLPNVRDVLGLPPKPGTEARA